MRPDKQRDLMIKYEGVYDYDALYKFMIKWFTDRRYDYNERLYKDKETSPVGREITVKMEFERRTTEYVRNRHNVHWQHWDAHKVTIVEDGKPKEYTHSRFKLIVKPVAEYDWQDFHTQNKLAGFISDLFHKYVQKHERWFEYSDAVQHEGQDFLDAVQEKIKTDFTPRVRA